ncbi:F-box only protein 6-like [Hyla sarda]|uniref:F-box only protein 6-like n=1 Tax=Hyla sarda TaxID=327740 RepID=UPI0024C401C8|nr:F-box only protein 6-like [Hyla sarda]XP_056398201.1 F-box only protein 6-like [Hyla sarda]
MFDSSRLPEEVLLQILSLVPATDLIRHCALVCTLWRDVIKSPTLWKMKCQDMGYISRECTRTPKDWKVFYYLSSKKRNLLENPCAADGFNSWNIEQNGGNQWKIEDLPGNHGQDHPLQDVTKYFVTSYRPCKKSQLIDLKKMGYGKKLLDLIQPDIVISDWYAARADCGCTYEVHVKLLSEKNKIIKEFQPEPVIIEQWSDAQWRQMTHTFSNYGPGVRYVYFQHGGQDTQFWAGWYGIRVTNSRVTIEPEDLSA